MPGPRSNRPEKRRTTKLCNAGNSPGQAKLFKIARGGRDGTADSSEQNTLAPTYLRTLHVAVLAKLRQITWMLVQKAVLSMQALGNGLRIDIF